MKKRILIVDDDEELCREMTEILRDEGYRVYTTYNGFKAKTLAETNDYDLMLLDVKMPGMNGLEILKYLKEKNIRSRIVIMTGSLKVNKLFKNEEEPADEEITCLKLADGLVSKPFNPEDVVLKIRDLLTHPLLK